MILSLSLLLVSIAGLEAAKPESSRDALRSLLTDHFTTPRHHVTNPDGLVAAENFIYDTFKSYNMQVVKHDFILVKNGDRHPGVNVVGLWPGRYFMTPQDRPFMLTAHYESPYDMSGVEDNGSGLAALLESARLITSQPCLQDYTVVFTAFDLEEWELATAAGSACNSLGCGSREFVNTILLPYLAQTGVEPDDFMGAVVMDTIMNFNSSAEAQVIPGGPIFGMAPGLTQAYASISNGGFLGDFLATISREPDDFPLLNLFNKRWAGLDNPQYKTQSLQIPISDVVNDLPTNPYAQVYQALIRGDFYNFWAGNYNLTAMFLTDTGDLRGGMQSCYHHSCDDMSRVTPERLNFLKKTTDAITGMLWELANGPTCRGTAVPQDFKTGLRMNGNLVLPYAPNDFRFTVTSYNADEVVMATFSNDTLTLNLAGRFDHETLQLTFRLSEPTKAFPGQIDPLQTMAWVMSGQLMTVQGSLVYTGQVQGLFGPQGGDVSFAFLSSGNDSSGTSTLSIIFFVSSGVLFLLAIALYAYTICKTRKVDEPFSQDQPI